MTELQSQTVEKIIDQMILEKVPGMDESFRDSISNKTLSEKRMDVLSLVDTTGLFRKIKSLNGENISKMDHIKEVVSMLREYVRIGTVKKKCSLPSTAPQ